MNASQDEFPAVEKQRNIYIKLQEVCSLSSTAHNLVPMASSIRLKYDDMFERKNHGVRCKLVNHPQKPPAPKRTSSYSKMPVMTFRQTTIALSQQKRTY